MDKQGIEKTVSHGTEVTGTSYGNEKHAESVVAHAAAGETLDPIFESNFEVDPFHQQRDAKDNGDYVDFRTMGWFRAGLIATAENIALGILSFPSVFQRLGLAGGIITTLGLGLIAFLTAWIMVDFKIRHMGVMHFGDAGGVVFGKWGARIFGWGMVLKATGLAGSHVLVGQTAFEFMTNHVICNVWWGFIVTIVSIIMSYNRQWHKLWWLSFVSLACIFIASFMNMIGVGIGRHSDKFKAQTAKAPVEYHAAPTHATLTDVLGAFTNIVFAYGGNMACFSFCSEMKKPNDFKKSFAMSQIVATISYIVVGTVIYCYGGDYTTSPAIGMLDHKLGIAAYAIAMVTIMVSGILGANVGIKYIYVTTLRNSPLLTSKSLKAQMYWMLMVAIMWIAGFILSELIPFFNPLLTIVSSLFSVWFVCGGAGFLWIYDNHPRFAKEGDKERAIDTPAKWFFYIFSIFVILISCAITPLGLYSAGMSIKTGYSKGSFHHPFAC
ncbi:hypothetical protein Q8F55_008363 [Vanrija albida]|uniref:Amino acid transporter transmembrane domain-containing protein n=1 Tax=Vanrija albida TaxID=181172 RepID=A0ABR3PWZ2_9TREE